MVVEAVLSEQFLEVFKEGAAGWDCDALAVEAHQLDEGFAFVFRALVKAYRDDQNVAIFSLIVLIGIDAQLRVIYKDYIKAETCHLLQLL